LRLAASPATKQKLIDQVKSYTAAFADWVA